MLQGSHSHHWNNPTSYQPSIFGNFFQTQKYLPYSETLGSLLASWDTRVKGQAWGIPRVFPPPAGLLPPGKEEVYPAFLLHKFKAPGLQTETIFPPKFRSREEAHWSPLRG